MIASNSSTWGLGTVPEPVKEGNLKMIQDVACVPLLPLSYVDGSRSRPVPLNYTVVGERDALNWQNSGPLRTLVSWRKRPGPVPRVPTFPVVFRPGSMVRVR